MVNAGRSAPIIPAPGDAEAIRLQIKGISQAWLHGRLEELDAIFHPDIVMVQPKFGGRVEGREACVATYRDFIAQAAIREYRESEPVINVWSGAAVASYQFHMIYELAEETFRDTGHDVFVFSRGDNGWRAVWRTMILF